MSGMREAILGKGVFSADLEQARAHVKRGLLQALLIAVARNARGTCRFREVTVP
jgi:hypothetical protein